MGWCGLVLLFLVGVVVVLVMVFYYVWLIWIVSLFVLLWWLDGVRCGFKFLCGGFVFGFVFGMGYFLVGIYWVGFVFIN